MSLMKKLSIGFLAAVIGIIIIVSSISNYMIGKRFNNYLMEEQNAKITKIIKTVQDLYDEKNGFLNFNRDEIYRYAVMEELYVEIKDVSGKEIFNSGNSYLSPQVNMNSMMGKMMGTASNTNSGNYKEETYTLVKNNETIGKIVIGYFGASYFSQDAMKFRMTLNQAFILSALIALIIGLGIGFIMSKQLSSPLAKITNTANEMRNGNLEVRANIITSTKEIKELSTSINYLAETLQKQEALRKRLTSDMAHEIRTPLTTLKTHVEAMLDGIWEPTEERLHGFYDEIERLTKLVENLRNLAKLEQADLVLNKSKFNLSEELKKVISSFEPLYTKKSYGLYSDIIPNINVNMDKDKFKQIMHNLLSNAYKYMKDKGEVLVSLNIENNSITIKIKDNGIGISKKDIPYIFERFYRTDMSRNKNTGGSGIGLTITKTLVEAHGGKISVESKLGEGTIFTVKFPKV
jgi:signal transduction histidine kinase